VSHLLVTRAQDDSIDWDEGWQGTGQFVIVQMDGNGVAGDRAIEADNLDEDNDASPRSSPVLYNVTLVGSNNSAGTQGGALLRRGTAGDLGNFIVVGFPARAVDIRDAATAALWRGGELSFHHSLFFDNGVDGVAFPPDDDDDGLDEDAEFRSVARGNSFEDPLLADPWSLSAPNFVPGAASPAASGTTPPAELDESATYMGAIEPGGDDWTEGWTAFPES
jgi:hypothetical protein